MKRAALWSIWAAIGLTACINENSGRSDDPNGAGGAGGVPGDATLGDAGPDPDGGLIDAGEDPCADVVCAVRQFCEDGRCIGPADGPEIDVLPATVDFGRVGAGEVSTIPVTVTNIGSAPLEVSELTFNGSPDFRVWLGDIEPMVDGMPADPDEDGAPGVSPGESFELTLVYAPLVDGPDQGEITLASNDPNQPQAIISLTANGSSPCIQVNPEALEFGGALLNRETRRPIRIESCGGAPLEIFDITLSEDTAPAFALAPELPDFPLELPARMPDGPPPSQDILIGFSPAALQAYTGTAIITSNDPLRPIIEVPISGQGSDNQCPVAVVTDALINALPRDIIELDGALSTDVDGPGGRPVQYEWRVTQRPDGSTSSPVERFQDPSRPIDTGIPDDDTTPTALFLADLAGSYTLELAVTDNLGLTAPSEACPQPAAIVRIEARVESDVHVEVVWNTPDDPDQTDSDGTDVDLHLRHPNGRNWSVAPLDCYYANAEPDWGPVGEAGNPRVELDDINGAGPEIISLDTAEDTTAFDGSYYRVGVHYYRADNFATGGTWGPSEVTTRIYLQGELAGEWIAVMADSGNFWEVADIVWTPDEKRVIEVDEHFEELP